MVILVLLAIIGMAAIFAVLYWLCSVKFPKIGSKIDKAVSAVGSKFKKKDTETVEDLNKLDK